MLLLLVQLLIWPLNSERAGRNLHVAAHLLLEYKMRLISSTSSILYTTVLSSKTSAASVICAAPFPKSRTKLIMRSGRRRSKNRYTEHMDCLLRRRITPIRVVKSHITIQHTNAFGDFFMLACDNASGV